MEIKRREGEQPDYEFTSVDGRLFQADKRTGKAEPVYETGSAERLVFTQVRSEAVQSGGDIRLILLSSCFRVDAKSPLSASTTRPLNGLALPFSNHEPLNFIGCIAKTLEKVRCL